MSKPIITVAYSHGRFGSPWYGFKVEALREVALSAGVNMISVSYPEELTVQAMEEKLFEAVCDDIAVPGDLVFLSSSRGAYLSTRVAGRVTENFALEPNRMDDDKPLPRRHVLGQFLIAPAFYIKPDYYPDQSPTPPDDMRIEIVHGMTDDIIDCDNSVRFARSFGAQLHLLTGGHRLNSQRDKLCILFDSFLKDCIADANETFQQGGSGGETRDVSDDVAPGGRS